MAIDVFLEELLEQQHKELMDSFQGLMDSIPKIDNSDILKAIEGQGEMVKEFTAAVRAIKFPTPQVNVEQVETVVNTEKVDQTGVIDSIQKMGEDILKGVEGLKRSVEKEKPMAEWRFNVYRNEEGFIQSVNATQIK